MKRGVFLLIFLAVFELVSAEIIIDNVDGIYSIGDEINLSFSIEKQKSASDYVEVYLQCGERNLVHKKYYSLEKNQKKELEIEFPTRVVGDCFAEVVFDGEKEESSGFEISNNINIEFSINNKLFFPGEKVYINGTAKKASGERLEGIIEISLEKIENRTLEANEGNFFGELQIKQDMLPGKYDIEIEATEKNKEEEIINRGTAREEIEVKSKPTYLEIDSVNSTLPSEFTAKIDLLNQARNIINNESVIVKLFNPQRREIVSRNVKSGEVFSYNFPENAERGFWEIRAYYGGIFYSKPVNIEDNKKIDFRIVEEGGRTYLEINNTGNVVYEGNFEASLGNSSDSQALSLNISLDLGESEKHSLDRMLKKGNYTLSSPEKNATFSITGAAISGDLRISWISYVFFFILVLIFVFIYLIARSVRRAGRGRKLFSRKEKQKNEAFMIFMDFERFPEDINEIVEREGLSLSKVSGNLYYILFYRSHKNNPEFLAYSLAKRIRNMSLSRRSRVGIVVNSGSFYDKEKFLKSFSFNTRKMVDHAKGGILISKEIAEKTKVRVLSSVKFTHEGNVFDMFRI
jgi:hypothetical protein